MMPDPKDAKLMRVLHEKALDDLTVVTLANYEVGGKRLYGVCRDGVLEFLGTKAEAREYYGTWRRGQR